MKKWGIQMPGDDVLPQKGWKSVVATIRDGLNNAAVGAVVGGILTGLFLYNLQSRDPHLTLYAQNTVKFQGERNQFGIVSFSVASDGSKEAEAVECFFDLGGAKIQEARATPENLRAKTEASGGKATVSVERLNPGESVEVVAWVTDAATIPDKIEVSVRAKGIKGERGQIRLDRIERENRLLTWTNWLITAVAAYLIATSTLDRRKRRREEEQQRALTAQRHAELDEREVKWKLAAEDAARRHEEHIKQMEEIRKGRVV